MRTSLLLAHEPVKSPSGFGLRQASRLRGAPERRFDAAAAGAFRIAGLSKSGRRLPHSKTLARHIKPYLVHRPNVCQIELEAAPEPEGRLSSRPADRRLESRRSWFIGATLVKNLRWPFLVLAACTLTELCAQPGATRETPAYKRIKASLDAIPAIDTHDHLWPFEILPGFVETDRGRGMNLSSLWRNSYYGWFNPLTAWKPGGSFDAWWAKARSDFQNARATSFYRYQLPAFKDLYGIDFDIVTDGQARDLDERIFKNYQDQKWLYQVVTERANIELMFNDPYWARLKFTTYYPFEVLVFNVTLLPQAFHPSEYSNPWDSPYRFAHEEGLPMESLDDYLKVLDRLFVKAKAAGAVCLKTTLAYVRTLDFENVPKEAVAPLFGRPRNRLTPKEAKAFEDFIMWRLVELSAKHELPFQIHTGQARIQGSNPMLLVDLIEANPKTQFILFHGGFPWVGETGVILMRHSKHVWIDSVWLPTLSYTTAKRAFHEWLEVMPSDRILWGADCNHAEGIYGATAFTRMCLAEVLAEKLDRGDLREEQALQIGRQVLRENALQLFPQLKARLWKHKGPLMPPAR